MLRATGRERVRRECAFRPKHLPTDELFLERLSKAVSSSSIRNNRNAIRSDSPAIRPDRFSDQRPQMNPRLVALSGPLKGQVITLTAETSIGRGSSNQVAISDPSLSRRHCLITSAEGEFTLADLGSSNGAYINGVP